MNEQRREGSTERHRQGDSLGDMNNFCVEISVLFSCSAVKLKSKAQIPHSLSWMHCFLMQQKLGRYEVRIYDPLSLNGIKYGCWAPKLLVVGKVVMSIVQISVEGMNSIKLYLFWMFCWRTLWTKTSALQRKTDDIFFRNPPFLRDEHMIWACDVRRESEKKTGLMALSSGCNAEMKRQNASWQCTRMNISAPAS